MFQLKGKLSDGRSISGILSGDEPGAALTAAASKLPEGITFAKVTLTVSSGSALKVTAPRAKKETAAADTGAATTTAAASGKKKK